MSRRVGWNCNYIAYWGAGAGGLGSLVHFTLDPFVATAHLVVVHSILGATIQQTAILRDKRF